MRLARVLAAAFAVTLTLAACGAQQPQAPVADAQRVAEALGGIASACAESAQLRALPGFGSTPRLRAAVLAAARMRATELRHAAGDPGWIYQGATLAEVRSLARERLRECGLGPAAVGL